MSGLNHTGHEINANAVTNHTNECRTNGFTISLPHTRAGPIQRARRFSFFNLFSNEISRELRSLAKRNRFDTAACVAAVNKGIPCRAPG